MKKLNVVSKLKADQPHQRAATQRVKRRLATSRSSANASSATPSLELYQMESCPFSHAVRNRLSQLGLDFVAHNVSGKNAENQVKHKKLVQAGGKDQIPFLLDHRTGVHLYEADAIIAYLDGEYGNPPASLPLRLARTVDRTVRARRDEIAWVMRRPLDLIRGSRRELSETVDTLTGTYRYLRNLLRPDMPAKSEDNASPLRAAS